MVYAPTNLHPDYSIPFSDQIRKLSPLGMASAFTTLGGSLLANQHWELGAWSGSLIHKTIALVEYTPLLGGIIAAVEKLALYCFCKTPNEFLKKYFKYIQKQSETELIKSKEQTDLQIKCSLIDHFSFQKPVSTVFFYGKRIEKDLIVSAFEQALKDFPLFAGRLKREAGDLYIDCNNKGIGITTVDSDIRLSELLSKFSELSPSSFVNEIDPWATEKEGSPVLKVKLSYFPDGMAIGYSWHHSVGDMATFMQFLKAVSASAKQENYPPPIILKDRENDIQVPPEVVSKQAKPVTLKMLSWNDIFQFAKMLSFPADTVYLYFDNEELAALQAALSAEANQKLTRNDVLCGHLLEVVAQCREDASDAQQASIAMNARGKLKVDPNTSGNILDIASISLPKNSKPVEFAENIHHNIANHTFDFQTGREFVSQNGGLQKVHWMFPKAFLPENRNLLMTSWANFGVYEIDFGIAPPDLFFPVGRVLLPWAARIVEGFHNQGRLVALNLPVGIAKKLVQPEVLEKIHKYRPPQSQKPVDWEWVN